jgi:hypothetical protein
MAPNDKDTIPPPATEELLARHVAELVHAARECGLADEIIQDVLQDAADALGEGLP